MNKNIVITAALRTPVARQNGELKDLESYELGATVLKQLCEKSEIAPEDISSVIMGNVLSGGVGMNPARQASIKAGLPDHVPASLVNQICGSGLRAIITGAQKIMSGESDIVLAGGMESMSRARHAALTRFGKKMGDIHLKDTMIFDGLTDAFEGCHMGITAENIAKRFDISREDQDKYALQSQQRAKKAMEENRFQEEIVPVETEDGTVEKDSAPRPEVTMEKLSSMKPAFKKDGGTVTAGNASGINDGAAGVMLMRAEEAEKRGLEPLGKIVSFAEAGVEPEIMGIGPVPASQRALERAGWNSDDLDLIEENEAFAAQTLYVLREMDWPEDKVNVNGGAIALGHPIGATGARLLVTLLHELKKRDQKRGLVTLCIGGGMGIALCVERR